MIVAVCLALLVAGEVVAARNLPDLNPENSAYMEHPRRFWTLRPGLHNDRMGMVYVNRLGLRGPEVDDTRPDQSILLLGDSRIYGSGLKDDGTLAVLLEKRLRDVTGKNIRVYNGGIPGYSSFQGLDLVKEVVPRLRPDVVCFAFLADGGRDEMEDKNRLGGKWAGLVRSFLWQSSLYQWARERLRDKPDSPRTYGMWSFPVQNGPSKRVTIPDHIANQREIARICRDNGASTMIFMFLPRPGEIPPPHFPSDSLTDVHATCLVASQEGLWWEAAGEWRSRPDRQQYFWDDCHFNAKGADLFADDMTKFLVRSKVVKPSESAPVPSPSSPVPAARSNNL